MDSNGIKPDGAAALSAQLGTPHCNLLELSLAGEGTGRSHWGAPHLLLPACLPSGTPLGDPFLPPFTCYCLPCLLLPAGNPLGDPSPPFHLLQPALPATACREPPGCTGYLPPL